MVVRNQLAIDLQGQQTESDEQVTHLEGQLTARDQQNTDLQGQRGTSNEQITDLERQLAASNEQVKRKERNQKVTELREQLTASNEQVTDLQEQLTGSNKQITDLQEKLTTSNKQVTDLQGQLIASNEQFTILQKQLTASNEQIFDLRRQLTTSNKQVCDLQRQAIASNEQVTNLQGQLTESYNQVTDLQGQEATSHKVAIDLRGQLTARDQRVTDLIRQLEAKELDISYLQRQLETATDRHREVVGLNQQLEEKWNKRDRRAVALEREARVSGRIIADLQGKLKASHKQVNDLRKQLTELQNQRKGSSEVCDWVISRDEIHMTDTRLGTGGWATVALGRFRGCKVAVKQIHDLILSPHSRKLFEREMRIASRCRHPCLLQFIGATNDDGSPLFVTELMELSLRALLERGPLSHTVISIISLDIAQALNYLHRNELPIIHRDISSANVLLWRHGNQWRGKVSDYGAANFMHLAMTIAPGAMIYSAPEASTSNQTVKVKLINYLYKQIDLFCCIWNQLFPELKM